MTIKTILKMGDPKLLEQSEPIIGLPSGEIDQIIVDLLDTMEANNGAGLAAPQIGILKQIVIFGLKDTEVTNERYPNTDHVPFTVLINPEIEPIGDEIVESWEGCLSIPNMRGLVDRFSKVRYRGLDQKGNIIDREVDGFHAIVVQHECDHLDGILYPMRMSDMSCFGFESELSQPLPENED
jgi:peptide deformylase